MLHLVLYEPEIPQNTGNMMRTCMATGTRLHLIQPLGFSLDEQHLKRAGMDYVKELEYTIYKSWEEFTQQNPSDNYYYMTRYGKKHLRSLTLPNVRAISILFWAKRVQEFPRRFFPGSWSTVCAFPWWPMRVP